MIDEICGRVASGGSIASISGEDWCPSQATIYRKMASDIDFRARMAEARAAQQEYEADLCVKMADEATAENWQVVKMRIWARQWRASKLAPKKYGDKIDVTSDGEKLEFPSISIGFKSPD